MTERVETSSIRYEWTYDVFINFRGEDTRHGFIGHLNKALNEKGVHTFFDDKEIVIGDEISPTLLKAIKESMMAITVFSKGYASSRFCLNELVQIHQCIKGNGRLIWPIFYDVDPSEVRHQKEKYGEALVRHKQNSRADDDKIRSWEHALYEIANLRGSSYDPRKDYEHELIEEIVNEIFRIIKRVPLYVAEYPVGLYSRVKKIRSLLQLGSNDKVIMMGICGTGGIGKTTIACAVYNAIADHFDYLCFLDDIKGEYGKHGIKQGQARMLSKISGKKEEIEDINQGIVLIKRIFKGKKVLLILDNVDEREQLEKLAGACNWFGLGSRIVITTRDTHLLKSHGVENERIYEMEGLNHEESLELLSWKAFRKMQVDDLNYKYVVEHAISYAGGLPLALELIGSDLYGKNAKEWESMLDGCKKIPHDKIQQILRVSYDGLQQQEKQVFLDIACFYKWKDLEYVKKMVKSAHDLDIPYYQIGRLVDKCLIKIEKDFSGHYIKMHDLVQDMGREIVRQESPIDAGKRSRLWSSLDICRVLERRKGTDEVIIIIQVESSECIEVDWNGKAFKSMKNLKILILEDAKFSKGPKYLPNSLTILRWRGYPSSSLPHGFFPKDLVEFDVECSYFKSIKTIPKVMPNVTVLNFGGCEYIRHIPNLSGLSRLRSLQLPFCKNLIDIDDSIGQLPKLETLNVSMCTQLMRFPSELNTPSLVDLYIDGCPKLNYFPKIVTREMKISELRLEGTSIVQLPPSVENLTRLELVCIYAVNDIILQSRKLQNSTFLLPKLGSIIVEGCGGEFLITEEGSTISPNIRLLELTRCNISNESLRICLASFSNVVSLDLTGSNFTILPKCIEDCQNLFELKLDWCEHLIEVEKVPPSIQRLTATNCTSLSSESRKLLLSKDLLASVVAISNRPGRLDRAYFFGPGESIPEWFDHYSEGSSISFWFRGKSFPSLCICAVLDPFSRGPIMVKIGALLNDKLAHLDYYFFIGEEYDSSHIVVHYIWDFNIVKSFEEDQWNHIEICQIVVDYAKESGIYVIRDEWTNIENIRFTDPFQSSDFLRSDQDHMSSETYMDASTEEDEPSNIISLDIPWRCSKKRKRNCLMRQHKNNVNSPNANYRLDSINNQGHVDTTTKKHFSFSQSEQQHTHSHAVLDIDSLRRLSAACRSLAFPISIHMNCGIVGSELEYDFYISKQDAVEFSSMQELCITITQLFLMFCNELCIFRGIDDGLGFLCPNAVQGIGCTREDRISYIGSTIKESNKQCWLVPILEGNHWTLCAICPELKIIYWFDSSLGGEQTYDIEKVFSQALETYKIIGAKNTKWLRPNYRRQVGDKECGHYIMRYMYDIIDMNEVDSLDTNFNNPQCYSQEDINDIQNKWVKFVRRVTLLANIMSNKDTLGLFIMLSSGRLIHY